MNIAMFRNRFILKAFATFFILEMLISTVTPTLSYALTAGPTAPEFSSFEPIDTTDLVNLASGELVYNLPLLEVPGPAGGYAMSLSYHSGIKLDQEASWVGLGWTLNPGSITRSVNGFADDNIEGRREVKDYWHGGQNITKTYSVGITIPKTGIGISYNLANSHDTFKGFSSSGQVGITVNPLAFVSQLSKGGGQEKITNKSLKNINKDNIESFKQNVNSNAELIRQQIGSGAGPNSIERMGRTILGQSSVDFNISSSGIKSSVSVAGRTFGARTGTSSQLSLYTQAKDIGGFSIAFFSVNLKRFHTRYWSDETTALFGTGTLYPNIGNSKINSDAYNQSIPDNFSEFQTYAFDVYDINDVNSYSDLVNSSSIWTLEASVRDEGDPSKQIGGSFPAYDQYVVTAQGLSGIMQPIIFENGDLHGQISI